MKIRNLRAEEIEIKIGKKNSRGFSIVLYKNARVDRAILDEVFGIMNWRNSFEEIAGELYCTVEVYDKEKGEWIAKRDVGSTFNRSEKAKSLATDAFKRACFKLGIGTELYDTGNIFIKCDMIEEETMDNIIYKPPYKTMDIKEIEFNEDKKLTKLIIVSGKEVIYSYEVEKPKVTEEQTTKEKAELVNEIITLSKKSGLIPPAINKEITKEELKEMLEEIKKGDSDDK